MTATPRTIPDKPELRVYLVMVMLGGIFGVMAIRAWDIHRSAVSNAKSHHSTVAPRRADILDRNGDILATSLETWSLHANPRRIFDANDVATALHNVLPDLDKTQLTRRLTDRNRAFVWVKRGLTPRQRRKVFDLGLEGLDFQREYRRVYPGGDLARILLGAVDPDGRGIAGLELVHDTLLRSGKKPLRLTLDARVQTALEAQIKKTAKINNATGVGGIVIRADSGAIIALASFAKGKLSDSGELNRITGAVYELGSVFKPITAAAALDADVISDSDTLDISQPVSIGSKTISQIGHGLNTPHAASLRDIIVHSSNTGIVHVAERLGTQRLQKFFKRIGVLDRPNIDFPGVARPLLPQTWDRLTTGTASFGHGLAVSPLSLALAYAVFANGGLKIQPSLVAPGAFNSSDKKRVITKANASTIVAMLAAVVSDGTGQRARPDGYSVAGKTGTAEKPGPHGYRKNANICSFVAVFPLPNPEYVALVVVDEPTGQSRNASTTAAPAMAQLVERIAPLLGVRPQNTNLTPRKGKG